MPACQYAHHPPSVRRKGRPSPATPTCIRQGEASPTHSPDTYMHTRLCPKRTHMCTHISALGGHTHTHISLPQEDTRVHVCIHVQLGTCMCAHTPFSATGSAHTFLHILNLCSQGELTHTHSTTKCVFSVYTYTTLHRLRKH